MKENLARKLPPLTRPVFRSDANGCSVALCQRRQPPKAGAVGQRLQRVAGQSSWTIKNDGWFRITQVRLTRERPYAKTIGLFKTDSSPFTRGFSPPPTIAEGQSTVQGGTVDGDWRYERWPASVSRSVAA